MSSLLGRFFPAHGERIRVHHGYRNEVGGPFVKLERMNRYFPNAENDYNLVYGVSGTNLPEKVLRRARRKKIPVVCHMNSCWHPAYSSDYENKNRLLKVLHNEYADFVVYGSRQAMEGARRYLGPIHTDHEIIFNAVDINHFSPGNSPPRVPVVLAAGLHQYTHRLEPLIRAMPLVEKQMPAVELVIAGQCVAGQGIFNCGPETVRKIIDETGFSRVRFIDHYSQEEAPDIYRQASVLVHLKHMDWTPNVVAEAMACGVPVLHTGNGGVPEIVEDAGVSLNIPADWDRIRVANPRPVADGVIQILEARRRLAARAREVACRRFNLENWIQKHRELFNRLLAIQ